MNETCFRAILFDFDGILADSERLHLSAFQKTLRPLGETLTRGEYFDRYVHCDDRAFFLTFPVDRGLEWDARTRAELQAQKEAFFQAELAAAGDGLLYPGAVELVKDTTACVPAAVASMALREEIKTVLATGGIESCFVGLVSAEDCERPKPDPEPYRRAFELVRGEGGPNTPADCLVVEDSLGGVRAGKAFGAVVAGVAHNLPTDKLRAAGADTVFETVAALRLALRCSPAEKLVCLKSC